MEHRIIFEIPSEKLVELAWAEIVQISEQNRRGTGETRQDI